MKQFRFGQNTTFNLSSTHNDIWGTNNLGTKNTVFGQKTTSVPSPFPFMFKNLNTKTTLKTISASFQPVTYEDKEDKIKVGRKFQNRRVKIMQFSEQINKANPGLKMNSVELRLEYLKNNSEQYKKGNLGYNRENLKTASKVEPFNKSFLFEFNKKSGSVDPNPFKQNVFNQNPINQNPFSPNPFKTSPFNLNPPQKSSIFEFKPKSIEKLRMACSNIFRFEFPQKRDKSSFKFPQEGEKLQVLKKNKDSKTTESNFACHNCFSEPNCFCRPQNLVPQNLFSESKFDFNSTFLQSSSTKQTVKPAVSEKLPEKIPDSLILQHSKSKIIKHMELRNSIQDHLNNQPFDHDKEQLENDTLVDKPVKNENVISFKMSTSTRRHLFKPVRQSFDLSKPKTNQTKSKNSKTSQIQFSNNRKITISQIKVRVVHTKNI